MWTSSLGQNDIEGETKEAVLDVTKVYKIDDIFNQNKPTTTDSEPPKRAKSKRKRKTEKDRLFDSEPS